MLQGTLKTFSLVGLLQMCSGENSSGALNFFVNGQLTGKINFNNGEIYSANFFDMRGDEAVRQISLLEDLEFEYSDKSDPGERTIDIEVDFLVIDCTRYIDECNEYMAGLKKRLSESHSIAAIGLYQYNDPRLRALHSSGIQYFEWMENGMLHIIYFDKTIKARVKVVFNDSITTDYLLINLRDKGMLQ